MSRIADLLNHGEPERAATAAAGAPPAPTPAPPGPKPTPPAPSGTQPAPAPTTAPAGPKPSPPRQDGFSGGGDWSGRGQQMQVQRQALERAAAAAPDVEADVRAGLRPIGSDSREAVAGLRGWATAGALDKVAAGWHTKLNAIADHVADFEPKLKETARHVEQAEQNTTQLIQRLQAW